MCVCVCVKRGRLLLELMKPKLMSPVAPQPPKRRWMNPGWFRFYDDHCLDVTMASLTSNPVTEYISETASSLLISEHMPHPRAPFEAILPAA